MGGCCGGAPVPGGGAPPSAGAAPSEAALLAAQPITGPSPARAACAQSRERWYRYCRGSCAPVGASRASGFSSFVIGWRWPESVSDFWKLGEVSRATPPKLPKPKLTPPKTSVQAQNHIDHETAPHLSSAVPLAQLRVLDLQVHHFRVSFPWFPAVREKRYAQDCAHAKGYFRRMSNVIRVIRGGRPAGLFSES